MTGMSRALNLALPVASCAGFFDGLIEKISLDTYVSLKEPRSDSEERRLACLARNAFERKETGLSPRAQPAEVERDAEGPSSKNYCKEIPV